jgi:flavin reductase (DIM6/NTAB) family NADH-FMN oxidoreductase RutF
MTVLSATMPVLVDGDPFEAHSHSAILDPMVFRKAMGQFATGVTIVTTQVEGRVHGMTANAFLSVSLDPPLVLISLGESRMAKLLQAGDAYGVSILAEDQVAHALHFAGKPSLGSEVNFEWSGAFPFISSAAVHVGCRIEHRYVAGDHTLFVGRVEHLANLPKAPLVFHTGQFCALRNEA